MCYIPPYRAVPFRTAPEGRRKPMAEDIKHLLIETNPEFRELASKHHTLDDRLHELEA